MGKMLKAREIEHQERKRKARKAATQACESAHGDVDGGNVAGDEIASISTTSSDAKAAIERDLDTMLAKYEIFNESVSPKRTAEDEIAALLDEHMAKSGPEVVESSTLDFTNKTLADLTMEHQKR